MYANPAIRNLIREGKSHQIPSLIQTGKKDGMMTMDDAIYDLYVAGKVSYEEAMTFAQDATSLAKRMY